MENTPVQDTLGITFQTIVKKYNAPAFVKQSSAINVPPDLSPEAFADPLDRQYPCHTKAATWLSCAYFSDNFDNIPDNQRDSLRDSLIKHASFHGIFSDFQKMLSRKAAFIEKDAETTDAPDDCYLIVENNSGEIVRSGLMDSDEAVVKAAEWLNQNRNDLTLTKCADFAGRILKRANDLGLTLSTQDRLERMRGIGISDIPAITRAIGVRASLCKDAQLSEQLQKLASSLEKAQVGSLDDAMQKVACVLDEADLSNMRLMAARRRGEIQLPEDVVYQYSLSNLKKMASETVHLQNGEVFDLSKLAGVNRLDFESALGSDLAEACYDDLTFLEKDASAILPTLPRTDAERLSAFLHSSGVEPEHVTKAASAISLPQDLLDYYG